MKLSSSVPSRCSFLTKVMHLDMVWSSLFPLTFATIWSCFSDSFQQLSVCQSLSVGTWICGASSFTDVSRSAGLWKASQIATLLKLTFPFVSSQMMFSNIAPTPPYVHTVTALQNILMGTISSRPNSKNSKKSDLKYTRKYLSTQFRSPFAFIFILNSVIINISFNYT